MGAPMSPTSPRAKAKAATRARILRVAEELFRERGYDEAQIRKIAADAGLSIGAVFNHFPDKPTLWREAMGREAPDVIDFLRRLATHQGAAGGYQTAAQRLLTDLTGQRSAA